ncbi:hypothetical protein SAMN02746089_01810 [Caldanaerobius fijiensis DSM 17918]|uniref:Coat F domain-containing protein n=1 Tax=Caldanaerobius fijiensis DSM 17918 TaxID=1121256 RepID=A0A1M5B7L5_9THEO|nr:hypothetical protein [Caldanaerobius fijiensis]SHF38514.1 hypothetical protein SAMN02746089_01810 [Caldanaerobius fijiensis DSM 17918]
MANLTQKELQYIEDSLSMMQQNEKCFRDCADKLSDNQLKTLCQQLAQSQKNAYQTIIKHLL